MLFQLKFRGRRRAAAVMADLFAERLNQGYSRMIVVPVPPRRRQSVRQDHMGLVCRYLRNRHRITTAEWLRRSGGEPQKELDYEERLKNLKNQFELIKRPVEISGDAVLIDDIFTTGATADECSRRLINGGFKIVHVLTFAIDLP